MENEDNIINGTLTFIALLVPIGLVWFLLYRRLKKYIKTGFSYLILVSSTLVALTIYFTLTAQIAVGYIALDIADEHPGTALVWGVSATAIFCILWPAIISVLLTIIFSIRHYIKKVKQKTADT